MCVLDRHISAYIREAWMSSERNTRRLAKVRRVRGVTMGKVGKSVGVAVARGSVEIFQSANLTINRVEWRGNAGSHSRNVFVRCFRFSMRHDKSENVKCRAFNVWSALTYMIIQGEFSTMNKSYRTNLKVASNISVAYIILCIVMHF